MKTPVCYSRWLRVFAPLCALACSQVLGINDAYVDPQLVAAGSAGASHAAGTQGGGEGGAVSGAPGQAGGQSGAGVGGSVEPDTMGEGGDAGPGEGGAGPTGQAGTTTNAGSGGRSDPQGSLCERYCDGVMSHCKGKYEQYRHFEQCIAVCKQMPAGSPGDQNLNSVECRLRQAEFADSEPFVYCKSAGPLGAGKCGSNCASYCGLMQNTCTAESTAGNLEPSYFENNTSCLSACAAIVPDEGGPTEYTSSATVDPVTFVGNHVYCRVYHLTAAIAEDSADEHCPHAIGGDPCIPQ